LCAGLRLASIIIPFEAAFVAFQFAAMLALLASGLIF
jgi:hypothetical protein